MLSRAIINIIIRKSICSNARTFYYAQNFLQSNFLAHDKSTKEYNIQNQSNLYIVKRFKYIRKKTADDKKSKDEDSDEEEDEEEAPAGSKILTFSVTSLRLDTLSKTAFGITRNKIEEAFYASKFRINGDKVFKKSVEVDVGDEIDIVSHRSLDNPGFLIVNRVVILSTSVSSNSVRIKVSRDKNLLIEDYEEPWSGE